MPSSPPALLLSLRPRFAQAILQGTKTVELRRRPVKAPPGTPVILYASTPIMAIVGTARLERAVVCEADAAWRRHGPLLGLAREEFDRYLDGGVACLLILEGAVALDAPLPLRRLQRRNFRPPQSYRYVSPTDPLRVRSLVTVATGLI